MNPTEYLLVRPEAALPGVKGVRRYMCEKCKQFHASWDLAQLCCDQTCEVCGKPLPPHKVNNVGLGIHWKCEECTAIQIQGQKMSRIKRAEVIPEPTTRFIYSDNIPGGYVNLDDYRDNGWTLREILEDVCHNAVKPVPVPCYVHDCDEEHWKGLNVSDAIESGLEEWFDDAADHIVGLDELLESVRAFNAKQELTQYHPALDRVIVIYPAEFNNFIRYVK
ncbi:TPA: hypothetical protein JG832_002440 [Enterobacter hormaechei subsp. xiangfangensis]|nr:hypothetical protein [Enterobacter hormaechei subsp. xiangfangensis]HAV1890576.1 hypothetical protein [Enterobacter hormaechei subsp. xiangfangensis]